jgi:hypothetical protein
LTAKPAQLCSRLSVQRVVAKDFCIPAPATLFTLVPLTL